MTIINATIEKYRKIHKTHLLTTLPHPDFFKMEDVLDSILKLMLIIQIVNIQNETCQILTATILKVNLTYNKGTIRKLCHQSTWSYIVLADAVAVTVEPVEPSLSLQNL